MSTKQGTTEFELGKQRETPFILPGRVRFESCCRIFLILENLGQPGGLSYSILLVYQTGGVLS